MAQALGTIVQCIGAVTDIQFDRESMPGIYDALILEDDPTNPTLIRTVWGIGYKLVEAGDRADTRDRR